MKLNGHVLTLLVLIATVPLAHAGPVYATENFDGIWGVASFSSNLDYQGQFFTGDFPLTAITAGGNDIYVSSATSVYEYDTSGNLLNRYSGFPAGSNITGLAFSDGNVYAPDNVTGLGISSVLTLDDNLDFTGMVFGSSASPANEIAANANSIYVSSATSVYEYDTSGAPLGSYSAFPSGGDISGLTLGFVYIYAIDNFAGSENSEVLSLFYGGEYTGTNFIASTFPLGGIAASENDIYVTGGLSV